MDSIKKYCVYKHTSPSNKIYIGITSLNPLVRWKNGKGYHNSYFDNAIQKYGWDNIKHEILFANLTKEEAEQKEIELIKEYNSTDKKHGYNIAVGGCVSSGWNRTFTEEQKENMRKGQIGKKYSKETRMKLSSIRKGHPVSEETRKKISGTLMGHAPQRNKKVKCIETGKVYISVRKAGKETDINSSGISKACRGKQKNAGGFHWIYIEDALTNEETTKGGE